MNSVDYVPMYDDSVQEWLPNHPEKGLWQISQYYCLLPSSALLLASLFTPAPVIFMAPPIVQAPGSPFAFTHPVPWLRFNIPPAAGAEGPTVQERNAGQLATYWGMPGVPLNGALAQALVDVNTPVGV